MSVQTIIVFLGGPFDPPGIPCVFSPSCQMGSWIRFRIPCLPSFIRSAYHSCCWNLPLHMAPVKGWVWAFFCPLLLVAWQIAGYFSWISSVQVALFSLALFLSLTRFLKSSQWYICHLLSMSLGYQVCFRGVCTKTYSSPFFVQFYSCVYLAGVAISVVHFTLLFITLAVRSSSSVVTVWSI